jgi:hypothetical protein
MSLFIGLGFSLAVGLKSLPAARRVASLFEKETLTLQSFRKSEQMTDDD